MNLSSSSGQSLQDRLRGPFRCVVREVWLVLAASTLGVALYILVRSVPYSA